MIGGWEREARAKSTLSAFIVLTYSPRMIESIDIGRACAWRRGARTPVELPGLRAGRLQKTWRAVRSALAQRYVCAIPFVLAFLASGCQREQAGLVVTFRDLVAGLTNTTQIACLDAPAAHLVSSFDPTGGNDDFNHPLRQGPDGWAVLADLKGPGYVSRFWMTGAADGKWPVRFFFDGEKMPRIDTTLDAWCGKKAPFLPPLAAYDPFCWYSFVPVPYRKRLVIMTKTGGYQSDGGPRLFYQIGYCTAGKEGGRWEVGGGRKINAQQESANGARKWARTWTVESYPKTLSPVDVAALARAREALMRYNDSLSRVAAGKVGGGWEVGGGGKEGEPEQKVGSDVKEQPEGTKSAEKADGDIRPTLGEAVIQEVIGRISVSPGHRVSFDSIPGPAIIDRLELTPDFSGLTNAISRDRAMRDLILRIYWDDCPQPSVEVPFGDFFGSVWRPRQYESFYFGMTGGVYTCRFPMPFQKKARIELENLTTSAVGVGGRWTVAGGGEDTGQRSEVGGQRSHILQPTAYSLQPNLGYFHAGWKKSTANDVGRSHSILQAQGRGRYVGCILSATSFDKSWWLLEGDEFMSVDGEPIPSWRGTGLEDYFNGGWYYGSAIIRPFNGLPMKAHFRTIQYRLHHVDPVAFTSSIRVNLERGPDNASHGTYESVAFYYLAAPSAADTGLGDAGFRQAPVDPMRQTAIMTELNDLERIGDFDGARDTIGSFLNQYPDFPYAPVLRLREILYCEHTRGAVAVKADVLAFLASGNAVTNPALVLARKQAEDWLWMQSTSTNALLMAYCNTPTHAYLDGQFVGESGDPQRMQVFRVTVAVGPHALALKARYRDYPYWVLACLRTRQGDLACTSPAWRNAYAPTGQWAAVDYDDSTWKMVGGTDRGKGPPEEPYLWLEPIAFPGVQAVAKGIWVSVDWLDKNRPVVFRADFETK